MTASPRWLRVAEDIIRLSNAARPPVSHISLESLNAARGRVPLSMLMERVWRLNRPQSADFDYLLPEYRQPTSAGLMGGIASLPVDYAQEQGEIGLDPTDPWTSLFMLCARLRTIAETRAQQYADMWIAVNCRTISSTWMAFEMPRHHDFSQALSAMVNEYAADGWRPISQGRVESRTTSTGVAMPIPETICWGGVPENTGQPGIGVYAQARFDASAFNKYGVYNDLGFWKAVLFEELVTIPFKATVDRNQDIMDRLWAELLRGGLEGFLRERDGGAIAASMIWHYGMVWTVSAFGWMQEVVRQYNRLEPATRERLALSPSDLSMLTGRLTMLNGIVNGSEFTFEQPSWAGPDGAHAFRQPDWISLDSWNPAQVSLDRLIESTMSWSPETARWAGGLHVARPDVVVERPRQRPAPWVTGEEEGPELPVRRERSSKIPFVVGLSIPVLGYWMMSGKRRGGTDHGKA